MCEIPMNNGNKEVGVAVWTEAGWLVHINGRAFLVRNSDDLTPVLKAGGLLQSMEAEKAVKEFNEKRKQRDNVVKAVERLQTGLQAVTAAKTQPFSLAAMQAGAVGNVDVGVFGVLLLCAAGDRLGRLIRNLF